MSTVQENQIKMAIDEGHLSSKTPFALCVDDEETNLEILEIHLKKAGFKCKTVTSGDEALKFLEESKEKPDVILLDIMMPGMDGIQVLKAIKSDESLKPIPVIMQTAVTQESKNIEGIEAGAYYYITKPYSHKVLVSIVMSALKEKRETETINDEVVTLNLVIDNIKSCSFEIKEFHEARKLANYLSRFSNDPGKYVVGLTALMVNAIEHGNLELGFDKKQDLLVEGTYDEEVEKRLKNPLYKDKRVLIEIFKKEKQGIFSIVIKDEGSGFDWQDYMDFEPTRMTDPNGRGIAMAAIMNPNGLEYWGKGNVAIYKIPIRGLNQTELDIDQEQNDPFKSVKSSSENNISNNNDMGNF
jgi:DNA-binding response OmpR family regulator